MKKRDFLLGALAAGTCMVTTGCAPLFVGGAAVVTGSTLIDRRSAGVSLNDELFEHRVAWEIRQALKEVDTHITVTSYNAKILLTGEVPTQAAKNKAYKTAKSSLDVGAVVNELAVMPNSSFKQRVSDSALAAKVTTRLIAHSEAVYSQMKVVADRGIIYLMGLLSPKENKIACEVAATTSGVKKVVSVCEILSPERIAQIQAEIEAAKKREEMQEAYGR